MRVPIFKLAVVLIALIAVAGLGRAGDLKEQGFGKRRGGLAMRARGDIQPIGKSPVLYAVDVEIRATDGKAVSLSEPFSSKLVWRTGDDKPLPEGIIEFPSRSPLERAGVKVEPGKPLQWTVSFLRMSETAPKKLQVLARLEGGRPVRYGTPRLASPLLTLDLSRLPVPKTLEEKHVVAGWTSATRFVYHLYEGLRGWRMLEVQPNGAATVFRSKVHGDLPARAGIPDLPSGEFSARLTTAEKEALAESFLKQRVWTLDDLPKRMLIPDESSARFSLVADDAALLARYPIAEAEKANKDYSALEKAIDALMHRIVKRAQKGKERG